MSTPKKEDFFADKPFYYKIHLDNGIPLAYIDDQGRLIVLTEQGETIVLSQNKEEPGRMTIPEMLRYMLESCGIPIVYTDDQGRLVEEFPDGKSLYLSSGGEIGHACWSSEHDMIIDFSDENDIEEKN